MSTAETNKLLHETAGRVVSRPQRRRVSIAGVCLFALGMCMRERVYKEPAEFSLTHYVTTLIPWGCRR
jgi:hypothetical protein